MKKQLTLILCLLLPALLKTVSAQSWTQTGPNGGNIVNIQATPTHLVAATAEIFHTSGNIWLSGDDGQSWQDITGNLMNQKVANVWAKDDTIYASVEARNILGNVQDDGGIFRSVNNGSGWTRIWPSASTNGTPITYIQKGNTMFFGTISGILISNDQGLTWTSSSGGQSGQAVQVKCFESMSDTIFIGTRKGLFRSVNNCLTWTAASSGIPSTPVGSNWITGMAKIGGTLYASTYQKGVYKSTNRGTSWTAVNNGMTDLKTNTIYASGTDLYVGTIYTGVFKSTDGAATWSISTQGMYNQSVNCFFRHGSKLSAGGADGIYETTDNGNNWIEANNGIAGHIITSGKSGPNIIKGGGYLFTGDYISRIYRSANNGTTWQPASGNMRISSTFLQGNVKAMVANENAVLVSLSDNKLYKSLDWGDNWSVIAFPDGESPTGMVEVNNRIYATYNIGILYYTDDSGESWTLATASPDEYYNVMVKKGNDLFLSDGTYYNKVYMLAHGNPTLTYMGDVGITGSAVISAFGVLGDTLFASTTNYTTGTGEGIYKSGDNGATWVLDGNGLVGTAITSFTSDGNLLFARNAFNLFVKNNETGLWVNINSDLPLGNQANGSNTLLIDAGKLIAGVASKSFFTADLSQFTFAPPDLPGAISGPVTPCRASSQTYSVPNVPYVTYSWQFPAGWIITAGGTTSSVTVTAGTATGIILVTPSNVWGSGPTQYLVVTQTLATPVQPSVITGSATPLEGTSQNYSVTNVAGVSYAWTFPAGWIQTAGGTTNAITVTVGSGSGNITVTPSTACGNGTARTKAVVTTPASKTLNLTSVLLEGLYNGAGTMRQANDEAGAHFAAPTVDQIIVELHAATNYATIVYTFPAVNLSTSGAATITVPSAYSASYYITVKHRNSVETTTATAVSFAGSIISQSFGTPANVFGSNLGLMIDGHYVIYTGDVNQDGSIDSGDFTPVDNDASNYATGYLATDINGDGTIDSGDFTSIDNNGLNYIGSSHP